MKTTHPSCPRSRPRSWVPILLAFCLLVPGVAQAGAGDHLIELVFEVRDDDLQKLREPWIRLSDDKVDPFPLLDDGQGFDTGAGDHLWTGGVKMMGSPKVELTVLDRETGEIAGTRTLFLPVAEQARIILFVVEGEPGLLLLSERKQQLDAAAEDPTTQQTKPSDSGEDAATRFVYLLWVVLLLGLLGLGYLRVVVRRFLADFLPTWRKLGQYLDREDARGGDEDDG